MAALAAGLALESRALLRSLRDLFHLNPQIETGRRKFCPEEEVPKLIAEHNSEARMAGAPHPQNLNLNLIGGSMK